MSAVGTFTCGVILLRGLFILYRAYYCPMLMAAADYAQSLEPESGADTQPPAQYDDAHIGHVSSRSGKQVWLFYLLLLLAGLLVLFAAYRT
jgi:hypothetical protein